MTQTSFALMTVLGRAKEAAALANGSAIQITEIAIGDGVTVPSGGETQLYNEVDRFPVSGHGTVAGAANVAYFDAYLSAADGPYTIREAGLYDSEGDLIAIAHYNPAISKPVPSSGQTVEATVRLEVAFSNVASIVISVDPSMTVPLQRLSRLPWIPVLSMTVTSPPAFPAVGDAYLVPAGATGAWSGHSGKVAEYTTAGWAMIVPPEGHGISVPDGRVFERIGGSYIEKIAQDVQSGKWIYVQDTSGSANVLTLAPNPPITELVAGLCLRVRVANSNTGATEVNIAGHPSRQVVRNDGSVLFDSDLISFGIFDLVYDGSVFKLPSTIAAPQLRRPLTLYVNAAIGSDANDGTANTAGKALASIQGAVDRAFTFGPGSHTITVLVSNGSYGPVEIPNRPGPGLAIIGNDASPSSVIVDGGGTRDAFAANGPNRVNVSGLRANAPGGLNAGFIAYGQSDMRLNKTETGPCGGAHLQAFGGGSLLAGEHRFAGSGQSLYRANVSGRLGISSVQTMVLPLSVSATASADNLGAITASSSLPVTFVNAGNVTGMRFQVTTNAIIDVAGGGPNFFPGADNALSTGGQYV